jgi:hypothetical protein
MVLLGVARANTSAGVSPEIFLLQSAPAADWVGHPPSPRLAKEPTHAACLAASTREDEQQALDGQQALEKMSASTGMFVWHQDLWS